MATTPIRVEHIRSERARQARIARRVRTWFGCWSAVLLLLVAGSENDWFPWANFVAVALFGLIVGIANRRVGEGA